MPDMTISTPLEDYLPDEEEALGGEERGGEEEEDNHTRDGRP